MNVLGLITARGGSKSIPGKNLAPCGGEPLLHWTCRAATESRAITRAIISTDDRAIADAAIARGVEAPFVRPAELAGDTARSIDVARHAIEWLAGAGWRTDVVVLLQPTSPLRSAAHVDEAFALLGDDLEAVVSVVEVPHRFRPWSQLALGDDGLVRDYQHGELPFDRYRRQNQPVLYARNGPAVVVSRARTIASGSFYGTRCAPYVMSAADSIDIDDAHDLAIANWLLGARAREATS